MALGYLARPAELLALLAANTTSDGTLDRNLPHDAWDPLAETEPDSADVGRSGSPDHAQQGFPPVDPPPPDPVTTERALNRAVAFPADLLERLRAVDWSVLRPRHTLYLHLHETALEATPAAARIEGLHAATLLQLHGLLAGAHVTVKPIIDLTDTIRSTAYEHPESVKERVHLINGGDYWPYAASASRQLDYDHIKPYDKHGGPGQTSTTNAAPIGRRHHRYRTHAGYKVRRTGAARYMWTTPLGCHYLVDHRGTQPLTDHQAEQLVNSPIGLDLFPSPPVLVDLPTH